ncbi:transcriptional regulator family: Fungal Specific TF [Penicillium capsulatum]|nr:transcriptional regulator family: Fungal Specific TF [Penicillium capsulatum]
MSHPSWLEPTNDVEAISRPPLSSIFRSQALSLDVHKDMRTFMGSCYVREFLPLPFFHAAIELLRHDFHISIECSPDRSHLTQQETQLLVCLFSIGVLVQESLSAFADTDVVPPTRPNALQEYEEMLSHSHQMWRNSAQKLCTILYESFIRLHNEGQWKMKYAMNLVQVLGTLSMEARQGVEKCLLSLLYQLGNKTQTTILADDGWSPDSLLSSIHGH